MRMREVATEPKKRNKKRTGSQNQLKDNEKKEHCVCWDFNAGNCRRGDSCSFKHERCNKRGNSPRGSRGRSKSPATLSREQMKSMPCAHFAKGECSFGSKCWYLHEDPDAPNDEDDDNTNDGNIEKPKEQTKQKSKAKGKAPATPAVLKALVVASKIVGACTFDVAAFPHCVAVPFSSTCLDFQDIDLQPLSCDCNTNVPICVALFCSPSFPWGDASSSCVSRFDATATTKNYNFDRFGSPHFDFHGERLISSYFADNSVVLHRAEDESTKPISWCRLVIDEICPIPATGLHLNAELLSLQIGGPCRLQFPRAQASENGSATGEELDMPNYRQFIILQGGEIQEKSNESKELYRNQSSLNSCQAYFSENPCDMKTLVLRYSSQLRQLRVEVCGQQFCCSHNPNSCGSSKTEDCGSSVG